MPTHLCKGCTDVLSELFNGLRSAAQGWVSVQRKGTFPDAWICHLCANLCTQAENGGHVYDGNGWTVPDLGIDVCYLLEPLKGKLGQMKLYMEFYIGTNLESFTAWIRLDPRGTEEVPVFPSSPIPVVSPRNAATGRVSTCNESTLSFLKLKLIHCIENHPECLLDPLQRSEPYTYRLLDVGSNGNACVKLIDTTSSNKNTSRYLTLSHCWGSITVTRLTRDTETSLRSGILVEALPTTFRQAVEVTQHLGIKYLWVDSLCIFQDKVNASDWQEQSSYMGSIYASALCNIAASNALDSTEGLESLRYPLAAIPFRICLQLGQSEIYKMNASSEELTSFIVSPAWNYYEDVGDGVLNQRAWVLQERFLSSRIMHFGARDVYLECRRDVSSGIFQRGVLPTKIKATPSESNLKFLLAQTSNLDDSSSQTWSLELYQAWRQILAKYSRCRLTFTSDKFVAINGIVELVAQRTNDEFFCGLWRQCLLPQLLWSVDSSQNRTREKDWIAPTWSWASLKNTAITLGSYVTSASSREHVSIEHASMERLPSGQVSRASLVLRGKIAPGTLYMTSSVKKRFAIRYDLTHLQLSLDDTFKVDEWPPAQLGWDWYDDIAFVKVICMAVLEYNWEYPQGPSADTYNHLGILILVRCREDEETHKRIGVITSSFEGYQDYQRHETEDEYSIALV